MVVSLIIVAALVLAYWLATGNDPETGQTGSAAGRTPGSDRSQNGTGTGEPGSTTPRTPGSAKPSGASTWGGTGQPTSESPHPQESSTYSEADVLWTGQLYLAQGDYFDVDLVPPQSIYLTRGGDFSFNDVEGTSIVLIGYKSLTPIDDVGDDGAGRCSVLTLTQARDFVSLKRGDRACLRTQSSVGTDGGTIALITVDDIDFGTSVLNTTVTVTVTTWRAA